MLFASVESVVRECRRTVATGREGRGRTKEKEKEGGGGELTGKGKNRGGGRRHGEERINSRRREQ